MRFPPDTIYLDLQSIYAAFPPSDSVKYRLRQADAAVNFVYTNLTRDTAFDYRNAPPPTTGFGNRLEEPAATATVQTIPATAPGIDLFGGETGELFRQIVADNGGGVILVEGRQASLKPLVLEISQDGQVISQIELPLLLLEPEIAVDANRDGVIKLASEDASDATSSEAPFRFWLNEGVDGPGADAEETAEPGSFGTVHDYQKSRIDYKRDLEDWTQLKLSIPKSATTRLPILALNDSQSGLVARLEWSASTLHSLDVPRLKFVAAVNGTKDYLKTLAVAAQQIAGDQGKVIGQTDSDGALCIIPALLWQTSASGNLEANLLFEGAGVGQGQLVMVIYKDGQRQTEIGPVNIEIRSMQDFYEHWTANADDTDARGAPISAVPVHPVGAHPAPFEFTAADSGLSLSADPEGNEYILFVHGWRMKPYERRVFAETAAKRLYQLGYKGKYGFFSWPTEWENLEVWYDQVLNVAADPDHYDRCEAVARASGSGPLRQLLLDLREKYGAEHIHVFAHSMGNVVVSEALRALPTDQPVAAHYVACQSAEVASAYESVVRKQDGSVDNTPPSASRSLGGPDRYTYSPALSRAPTGADLQVGDNYHLGVSSRVGVMTNFYNGADAALSKWDLNQKLKPDNSIWFYDTNYKYDSVPDTSDGSPMMRDRYREDPPGFTGPSQTHELHWDVVPERQRMLAFIIQARSRATGATAGVKGEFQGQEANLSDPDYLFALGPIPRSLLRLGWMGR